MFVVLKKYELEYLKIYDWSFREDIKKYVSATQIISEMYKNMKRTGGYVI